MRAAALALIVLATLAGCTEDPRHASLEHAQLPPLVQAHRFAYQGDVRGSYQLSPDGRKLAWIGPSLGRSVLHVRDNATGDVRKYRVPLEEYHWTPDGRRLLYMGGPSTNENFHLYMIDVSDPAAEPVDLTPYPGVKAGLQQIVTGDPRHVLVYHNRRDPGLFDLYRIDLATRRETLVASNPGDATSPITAPDGSFKGWRKSRAAQRLAEEPRRPLAARRPTLRAEETVRTLGVSADPNVVWALSNRGRDRVALVAMNPALGWEKVIFEDPQVDVTHVTMSRATRAPLAAYAQPGYPRFAILDPKLRDDLKALLSAQGGEPYGFEIVNADDAEQRLVVTIHTNRQRRYYLVDRQAGTYVLLAESLADDIADALVPIRPVAIKSSDGLQLHGYLTLPRGAEPKRLPMVLFVHGGPWMRTLWSDPATSDDAAWAQFLANRGYAVLQVDFRGSSGYGRAFSKAGFGEFAGRMQEDLLDAVRWAVDGGIADPARVAIMGWSYGGYAALVGLTMTPETFACGVSLNGPTDLATLIESFPPYWTVDLSRWHDYVGDPAIPEDREQMERKSPLHYAQKLARPALLVQGGNDVRVRVDQADRMVHAFQRAGKQVEYLRIPEMGHAMGYWVHRLAVLRRTEDFLHRCLGGRASRFDWFDAVAWVWTRINRSGPPVVPPAAPQRPGGGKAGNDGKKKDEG